MTLRKRPFDEYTTLNDANFTLTGAPAGTGIESVTGISATQVEIALTYVGIDFDGDSTNFRGGNPVR